MPIPPFGSPPGKKGACGVSGVAGACGVSGVSGVAGACGVSGVSGVSGVAGACGVSGVSGVPGACGVSGVAGACGVSGVAGACGVSGIAGACGVSGTTGACGVSGISGVAGACGVSGVSGITGDIYLTSSSTSNAISIPTTSLTFTVAAGLAYTPVQSIIIVADTNDYMTATVTSYSGTTLVCTVNTSFGSGTFTSWTINLDGATGGQGACGVSGVSGVPGACGVSGVAGACGVSGVSGVAGACGVSGVAGACGVSGVAGACGVSGVSGVWGPEITRYSWISSTSGTGAATGQINFNNATLSSVTDVYLYDADAFGNTNWSTFIADVANTGTPIEIYDVTSGAYLIGTVGGSITLASHRYTVPFTYIASSGTFSASDAINIGFGGTAGACGVSGVAGACGVSGTAGTNGSNGACGVSGVSGVAGACGVSGTAGAAGACGVSGVSGIPGYEPNVETVSVTSNAGTCSVSYGVSNFTNSSAATMAITIATSGATDGQLKMVRIYDFSAVAQTIGWTNTENSNVIAPTTSKGSTTLPLTVGFQFNGSTSLWRCIASA